MIYTPNDFFEKYFLDIVKEKNYIWDTMLTSRPFSEEQLEELIPYAKEKEWRDICRYQTLSEQFIRKHIEHIDWNEIATRQKLSEDFMREYADKINWSTVSTFQKMSMNFMKEFADKLDWSQIAYHQEYDNKFVKEFGNRMHGYYTIKV